MNYNLNHGGYESKSSGYSAGCSSSSSLSYSSHSVPGSRASPVSSRSDYLPRGSGTGDYGNNPENHLGMRLDL